MLVYELETDGTLIHWSSARTSHWCWQHPPLEIWCWWRSPPGIWCWRHPVLGFWCWWLSLLGIWCWWHPCLHGYVNDTQTQGISFWPNPLWGICCLQHWCWWHPPLWKKLILTTRTPGNMMLTTPTLMKESDVDDTHPREFVFDDTNPGNRMLTTPTPGNLM